MDTKQMPLRMPLPLWEAARRRAGGGSLNAWIVSLIQREVGPATGDTPLLDTLALDEPEAALMEASLLREAAASVALDGETQAINAVPYEHTQEDGHLHKAQQYGGGYVANGARWQLRRCTLCGKDLPPKRV